MARKNPDRIVRDLPGGVREPKPETIFHLLISGFLNVHQRAIRAKVSLCEESGAAEKNSRSELLM
jgi:hypothetical protein